MRKFTKSKTENTKLSVRCNSCKRDTYHTVIRAVEYNSTFDAEPEHVKENGLWLKGTAQIIACDGCKAISFRDEYFFSEEPGPNENIYPPREMKTDLDELYLRDEVYTIPPIVGTIYKETLLAVERENLTLAGIGIRAIIESVCNEKKAKGKTLNNKIDELVAISLLTKKGAEILHGIRLLGNEAAHKMKAPSREQIIASMKVIDHLLLGVYIVPYEASVLPRAKPEAVTKPNATSTAKRSQKSTANKRTVKISQAKQNKTGDMLHG